MASLLSRLWGGSSRLAPPTVPTDEVLPMHPFDDTSTLRGYTLVWAYRFDEVLDADMLGDSLRQLFEMDGWRRLGGRLRMRPDGKIEIHVPREFTPERPALHFTKEHIDVSMAEHPEASKLPHATAAPTTFPSGRNYNSLSLGPGTPKCLEDYLYSDLPQFALHVVTFTDGTLVSVIFSHITSDLGGLAAILGAWQCILEGHPEKVPLFPGYKEDPIVGLYRASDVPKPTIAGTEIQGWKLVVWALRQMFDAWLAPYESRLVCIPAKVADTIVQEARGQLAPSTPDKADKPFISENDVVVALLNWLLAQSMSPERNLVTLMAVDPRTRVKSVFREDSAYVQNCPSAAFFNVSIKEARELPMGELALRSREAISAQCTDEAMRALGTFAYDTLIKTSSPPLFGDINSSLLVVSNWSKTDFYRNIDFRPAIVTPSRKDNPTPGRPVHFHSQSVETGTFATTVVTIMGRDHDNNLWISGDFTAKSWSSLLAFLNERV